MAGDIQAITDKEFDRFRKLIYEKAGISMAPEKKVLVSGRLSKRLRQYGLTSFDQYYQLIHAAEHPKEMQMMVDLLTTNETYFFREPSHFDYLQKEVLPHWKGSQFRVWSAACSTGEEVYTLAMVLAESLKNRAWEVYGSDLSTRVLESCRQAIYPMSRIGPMSDYYLHKYCLKGVRQQEGNFLIDKALRASCTFQQINLMETLPNIGLFDVIFLRNVMIYFDARGKQLVANKLVQHLKPNGLLFISHSESLHGITDKLTMLQPSIYRKKQV